MPKKTALVTQTIGEWMETNSKLFGTPIRLLSDTRIAPVTPLPTRILTVDRAFGCGGFPVGRVTEIYGSEGGGKCLSADTYCLSNEGLMTIEEIFASRGWKASCTSRVAEAEIGLVNELNQVETTSHFTWNYRRPVKVFTTRSGFQIKATWNHRLRVMNTSGQIIWRTAKDIQPGDYLLFQRESETFGSDPLSKDEGTLLGYLIADGSLNGKNRIGFTNSDPDVIAEYTDLVERLFAHPLRQYPQHDNPNVIEFHLNSQATRTRLFEQYGVDYTKAAGKSVPLRVRKASRETQIAFIRAYFELECYIDVGHARIEVVSASRQLLQEVQLMLLNLGIISLVAERIIDEICYYRLTISGQNFRHYGNRIGFLTMARQKTYAQSESHQVVQTNIDAIPHLGEMLQSLGDAIDTDREWHHLMSDYEGEIPHAKLTYDRLHKILEYLVTKDVGVAQHIVDYLQMFQDRRYYFDPVDICEDSLCPTFDVVMPKTHSFWSNGMISHNTTLCSYAVAAAQRLGRHVLYIDAENALDLERMAQCGVDVPNLIHIEPNDAETAMGIARAASDSGLIGLIVIDSIAALVPRAELAGEPGDAHVGLMARLMSQSLRMMTRSLNKNQCALICVNQLREKIGILFGNPETTPGGKALRFYASVRIDIRRSETMKRGDKEIGIIAKAKFVKNKVGKPYQVAFFPIYFEGPEVVGVTETLLDLALEYGILTRRGSHTYYSDQKIGVSREDAVTTLREQTQLRIAIEDLVRRAMLPQETFADVEPQDEEEEEGFTLTEIGTLALQEEEVVAPAI